MVKPEGFPEPRGRDAHPVSSSAGVDRLVGIMESSGPVGSTDTIGQQLCLKSMKGGGRRRRKRDRSSGCHHHPRRKNTYRIYSILKLSRRHAETSHCSITSMQTCNGVLHLHLDYVDTRGARGESSSSSHPFIESQTPS